MLPSTSLALACLSGRRLYTFAAPTSDSPAAYSSEGAPSSQWPVDYSTSLTHWDTKIANQTSNVQKIYPGYGLDAPRVAPINGTVSDWWYFHAFSLNGDGDVSSVNFNFYTTSPGGYPLLQNKSTILDLEIFGSFPNGTNYWANEYPQTASVMTAGSSSNGKWGPYGSWESSPDGKYWQLDFDMPTSELVGTVKIHSNGAPPHIACGPAVEGGEQEFHPHLWWSNALADGNAEVDLTYKGESLSFYGIGYHDKTWEDQNFYQSVGNWYWAQGRVGPYSFVFYDSRDRNGGEHFLSYIAKDGEIITSTCAENSVIARPWGNDITYPPTMQSGAPLGLTVDFDVEGKNFHVNFTSYGIVTENPAYTRWLATTEGGFEGEEQYNGTTVWEVVKLQ
ncbi:Tyrosinase family protein asqI [Fulvia fulva]|uniref:Tyrosinase family protein asqI n=1 Tax=Passalora fulva TaxID=5499 RepID=A0A9Q8PMZ7_PASFU|nr:Tyrosinase family protein asqI [Fulvia fulva]UJO25369.1 Tyrosinase family protein asqI [Fulvia fulva]WPV22964.1 Tyrosinase family protein asqI [Fulvia fulva]